MSNELDPYRNVHGCIETNGLTVSGHDYHAIPRATVDWTAPGLKVTRLRIVSDPGLPFWDVSYCHGELNGEPVKVSLPFSQLPKRRWRQYVVGLAIKDNVHAGRMGILDNVSSAC